MYLVKTKSANSSNCCLIYNLMMTCDGLIVLVLVNLQPFMR